MSKSWGQAMDRDKFLKFIKSSIMYLRRNINEWSKVDIVNSFRDIESLFKDYDSHFPNCSNIIELKQIFEDLKKEYNKIK